MAKLRQSAWIIPYDPDGYLVTVARRGKKANNAGQWNFFGGSVDEGETPIQAAAREYSEEGGLKIKMGDLIPIDVVRTKDRQLNYFAVPEKRDPRINWESDKWKRVPLFDMPRPLHKSVDLLFDNSKLPNAKLPFPVFVTKQTRMSSTTDMYLKGVRIGGAEVVIKRKMLINFKINTDQRGNGQAKFLMDYLLNWAPVTPKRLVARPDPDSPLALDSLVGFYERFGFKRDTASFLDNPTTAYMAQESA